MDYKFWILLLLCIVLFYMYYQIEDLKSEVQHLHTKTTGIQDMEKYIEKIRATEITKNLNNAINEILPKKLSKTESNHAKRSSRSSRSSKRSSRSSKSRSNNNSQSSCILESSTNDNLSESISNKKVVENYSNNTNSDEKIQLQQNNQSHDNFEIQLDDVMNLIEHSHMNHVNAIITDNVVTMNSNIEIEELSEKQKTNSDSFIDSQDKENETNEIVLNNEIVLENKLEIDNEDNKLQEEEINKDINNDEDKEKKYQELMSKNVDDLRKLAKEKNVDIKKSVDGKQKNKLKKELCQELAHMC